MAIETIKRGIDFLFGQTNAQQIKRLRRLVEEINALEKDVSSLSDEALRQKGEEFRTRAAEGVPRE